MEANIEQASFNPGWVGTASNLSVCLESFFLFEYLYWNHYTFVACQAKYRQEEYRKQELCNIISFHACSDFIALCNFWAQVKSSSLLSLRILCEKEVEVKYLPFSTFSSLAIYLWEQYNISVSLVTQNAILSSCADYIQVIRSGGIGVIESCGNDTGNNAHLLQERKLYMHLLVLLTAILMNIT